MGSFAGPIKKPVAAKRQSDTKVGSTFRAAPLAATAQRRHDPSPAPWSQSSSSPAAAFKLAESSPERGKPIDPTDRRALESHFGVPLQAIRIHETGAVKVSAAMGASAFTHGRELFFAPGRYQPRTPEGRHLLAHEIAHSLQEAGRATDAERPAGDLGPAPTGTTLEHEADAAAWHFLAGIPYRVQGVAPPGYGVQRQTAPPVNPNKMGNCGDLLRSIKEAVAVLIQRAVDLVSDPLGLQWDNWHTPKIMPDGTNLGSVEGHQRQYETGAGGCRT